MPNFVIHNYSNPNRAPYYLGRPPRGIKDFYNTIAQDQNWAPPEATAMLHTLSFEFTSVLQRHFILTNERFFR